jgi:hypothetical protein
MELTIESKKFLSKKKDLTYKMADPGDELIDVGHLGIPGRHPAHLMVVGIPVVEKGPVP